MAGSRKYLFSSCCANDVCRKLQLPHQLIHVTFRPRSIWGKPLMGELVKLDGDARTLLMPMYVTLSISTTRHGCNSPHDERITKHLCRSERNGQHGSAQWLRHAIAAVSTVCDNTRAQP
jgi:hypothetical protein